MAKTLTGVVSSSKADKTITVTVVTRKTHPIYKKAIYCEQEVSWLMTKRTKQKLVIKLSSAKRSYQCSQALHPREDRRTTSAA